MTDWRNLIKSQLVEDKKAKTDFLITLRSGAIYKVSAGQQVEIEPTWDVVVIKADAESPIDSDTGYIGCNDIEMIVAVSEL